jgi:hypothetical protein
VPRDDPVLLVVPRHVPRQLEDLAGKNSKGKNRGESNQSRFRGWCHTCGRVAHLGGKVLEDGGEVDGGAAADALGVASQLEVAPDAADGELEAGPNGAGDGLLLRPADSSATSK